MRALAASICEPLKHAALFLREIALHRVDPWRRRDEGLVLVAAHGDDKNQKENACAPQNRQHTTLEFGAPHFGPLVGASAVRHEIAPCGQLVKRSLAQHKGKDAAQQRDDVRLVPSPLAGQPHDVRRCERREAAPAEHRDAVRGAHPYPKQEEKKVFEVGLANAVVHPRACGRGGHPARSSPADCAAPERRCGAAAAA